MKLDLWKNLTIQIAQVSPLRGWTHKNSVFVRPLAQPLYALDAK